MTEPTQNTRWWTDDFRKYFLYWSGEPRRVRPGINGDNLEDFIKHIEDKAEEKGYLQGFQCGEAATEGYKSYEESLTKE